MISTFKRKYMYSENSLTYNLGGNVDFPVNPTRWCMGMWEETGAFLEKPHANMRRTPNHSENQTGNH